MPPLHVTVGRPLCRCYGHWRKRRFSDRAKDGCRIGGPVWQGSGAPRGRRSRNLLSLSCVTAFLGVGDQRGCSDEAKDRRGSREGPLGPRRAFPTVLALSYGKKVQRFAEKTHLHHLVLPRLAT
ncbi:Hypothetical protein NTJ_04735 [Nesidiocoris tenuis]|uniref:Uncharacterized protein n=1 Tax=Nesidiocoris tenuis TaxID=355587 RepID=A0ABN7ANG8_9HEMI|nr:Hypothetical protein NTJ_04735 [Nesidiocoris tenuis]